jgi:hypothetical protein
MSPDLLFPISDVNAYLTNPSRSGNAGQYRMRVAGGISASAK